MQHVPQRLPLSSLRRATSAHGPAPGLASTSTTTAAVPGTAGGAAVDAVPRKRLLDGRLAPAPVGRTNGDARGAPRPRVQDAPVGALPSSGAAAASAGAGGGGAAGGVHHPQQQQQRGAAGTAAAGAAAGLAARRAAGSGSGQGLRTAGAGAGVVGGAGSAAAAGAGAAAGAAAGPTKPDMTAKLGDTGGAGFARDTRSRQLRTGWHFACTGTGNAGGSTCKTARGRRPVLVIGLVPAPGSDCVRRPCLITTPRIRGG